MDFRNIHWIKESVFRFLLLGIICSAPAQTIISQSVSDPNFVDEGTAKAAAINYITKTDSKFSEIAAKELTLTLAETKVSGNQTLYYVYNINREDGYIIISANKNIAPVLAYVKIGSFNTDPSLRSPEFNFWLEASASGIQSTIVAKSKNTENQEIWDTVLGKGLSDAEEMVLNLTARWGQTGNVAYYVPGGYTGCVATAMGQILHYYKWPSQSTGSHSYVDPANPNPNWSECTTDSYGTLYLHAYGSTYDYSIMDDQALLPNYEIAKLLYNCGVSVDMDYSTCGSWTNTFAVENAIRTYFDYDASVDYVVREDYSDSEWEALLVDQIRMERPVQYRGGANYNGTGGHSWVVCGYQVSAGTMFYVNWGWGGGIEGLYSISGMGSFLYGQGAVINIFPSEQPDLAFTSASLSESSIMAGEQVTLDFDIHNNSSSVDAVATTATCYLSADENLDSDDILISTFNIEAIEADQTASKSENIVVDAEESGSYFILVEADPDHYVHEALEDNNVTAIPITISGSIAPYPFRSVSSGQWNDNNTWQYNPGTGWTSATNYPTKSSADITIQTGHIVTVSIGLIVDEVTIESGGEVIVSSGGSLSIYNGSDAIDFTVNGTLYNQGTISGNGGLVFNSGSVYEHARNGDNIPAAEWALTSECKVTGITSAAPTIPAGTQFGNFTWNCTSQSADIYLSGQLNNISGNFNILSTQNNTVNNWALILGDGDTGDLTVNGNFSQSGNSSFAITEGYTSRKMTVTGNFSMTNASCRFYISATPSTGSFYLAGNYTQSAGIFYGPGLFVFNGTTTQTYLSGGGTVSGNINYRVNNGVTLQMGTGPNIGYLAGGGTFTLMSGGSLGITSPSGITTSGITGNIQCTGTRSYSSGANYIYNGASNQAAGNGLPATVNSLTIENTGTTGNNRVTLAGSISVTGALTVTSGALNIGTYGVDAGTLHNSGTIAINSTGVDVSGSLYVSGAITQNEGSSVTYNRTIPDDGGTQLWHFVSSPVDLTDITSDKDFYPWDEEAGDWGDITTVIKSGIGYTVIGGGSISYTGDLLVNNLTVPVTSPYADAFSGSTPEEYNARSFATGRDATDNWGGGGWNLLGNPYTSALNVSDFIDENYNVTPELSQFDPNYVALYLYDGASYQYVSKTVGGWPGTYLSEDHIQAGQGFFVMAMNNSSEFTFKRDMQGHDGAVLLKSSKTGDAWPGLRLKAQYNESESSTLVVFNEGMTAGLDPCYDVGLMSTGPEVEIYTALALDNGVNFARQALPMSNYDENVVPVGIISEKGGQVTFSADIVPINHLSFYLEDRETGIVTNLNKESYKALLPPKTSGTGRFYIHAASKRILRSPTDNEKMLNLRIWASQNQIHIEGPVSENAICNIYDLQGHKTLEIKLYDAIYNTVTIPSGLKGVYLIKVIDRVKVCTQKVVFF